MYYSGIYVYVEFRLFRLAHRPKRLVLAAGALLYDIACGHCCRLQWIGSPVPCQTEFPLLVRGVDGKSPHRERLHYLPRLSLGGEIAQYPFVYCSAHVKLELRIMAVAHICEILVRQQL